MPGETQNAADESEVPGSTDETGTGETSSGEKSSEKGLEGREVVGPDGEPLSSEELDQLQKLKDRDAEVRQHEQQHLAAAGPHAMGGPTFDYQTGPDGKRYAIGGEVQIDVSEVQGDPSATIQKMQQIRRAALAPAEPSSADRAIAAQASQKQIKAQQDLAELQQQEIQSKTRKPDESEEGSEQGDGPETESPDEISSDPANPALGQAAAGAIGQSDLANNAIDGEGGDGASTSSAAGISAELSAVGEDRGGNSIAESFTRELQNASGELAPKGPGELASASGSAEGSTTSPLDQANELGQPLDPTDVPDVGSTGRLAANRQQFFANAFASSGIAGGRLDTIV